MLLMQATDKDFNAMASEAVNRSLRDGTPIGDCVVDVAKDEELTPEEVRRLVEKANTKLSIEHLRTDARKESFDLASYDDVVARTHGADDDDDDATRDEDAGTGIDADDSEVKTASLRIPATRVSRKAPTTFFQTAAMCKEASSEPSVLPRDYFTLRRELEGLKLRKLASERRVQDRIDWLASEFSRQDAPDFQKFASDAVAVCGGTAAPVVESLAGYLGVSCGLRKTAGVVDDLGSEPIEAMRDVCEGIKDIMKTASDIEAVSAAIDWCWKEVSGC